MQSIEICQYLFKRIKHFRTGSAIHHNAKRNDVGWLVDAGLGMRFWTPHQVAHLNTNDATVGIYTSSIFDISKFDLRCKYSVIPVLPIDENVVGLDIYNLLTAVKVVYKLRILQRLPVWTIFFSCIAARPLSVSLRILLRIKTGKSCRAKLGRWSAKYL